MRSFEWNLCQYDLCSYKERTFGHRHMPGRDHVITGKRQCSVNQGERLGRNQSYCVNCFSCAVTKDFTKTT